MSNERATHFSISSLMLVIVAAFAKAADVQLTPVALAVAVDPLALNVVIAVFVVSVIVKPALPDTLTVVNVFPAKVAV